MYAEAGLERLEAAIARQTIQDLHGIGDTAWAALTKRMDMLRRATRADFGMGEDRRDDGYGTVRDSGREVDDERDGESLRIAARMVAALFAPEGEDPALWMRRAIGNPHLRVEHWKRALTPSGRELSVSELRRIARMLRRGHTHEEVAELTGESGRQVERVSRYLGMGEWQVDRELMFIAECLERGMTVKESHRAWCELVPPAMHRSLKTWRRRYKALLGEEVPA